MVRKTGGKQNLKRRFNAIKFCKRCGKLYKPEKKHSKICPDCYRTRGFEKGSRNKSQN